MRDDLTDPTMTGRPRPGVGTGTIAAIIAAALIVGAFLLWGPWTGTQSNTASNPSPSTTTGSATTTRNAPAPTAPPATSGGNTR